MLMKGFAVSLLVLAVLSSAHAVDSKQNPEDAAILQTVQHYLHGLKFNDVESLKKAFYPEAKLFFVKKNGELGQLSQAEWYEGFKSIAGKEEEGDLRVASIDVSGNVASAKIEEDYPKSHYTDYVSLLKLNGEWKIVNKIYFASPKH